MGEFSTILPKPLLPIGEKTMLDVILENFSKHGLRKISLMINYKSNLIKSYINAQKIYRNIDFYVEKKELELQVAYLY